MGALSYKARVVKPRLRGRASATEDEGPNKPAVQQAYCMFLDCLSLRARPT